MADIVEIVARKIAGYTIIGLRGGRMEPYRRAEIDKQVDENWPTFAKEARRLIDIINNHVDDPQHEINVGLSRLVANP